MDPYFFLHGSEDPDPHQNKMDLKPWGGQKNILEYWPCCIPAQVESTEETSSYSWTAAAAYKAL